LGLEVQFYVGETLMHITTSVSEALTRYLDLTGEQMKLTASNMANVDTPGYRTQGFDFEEEFARELRGKAFSSPNIQEVDGLVSRPDGNNVSMDREGMQLAKEQLQFRLGIQLLRNEFSGIMSAIQEEVR
jgi:flagellar basal-body rod protein FlgB